MGRGHFKPEQIIHMLMEYPYFRDAASVIFVIQKMAFEWEAE